MELGTYKAVKDVAMRTGNSAWMLTDGGTIELVQIDKERSKALYRCGRSTDWMHFSHIKKCFNKVT